VGPAKFQRFFVRYSSRSETRSTSFDAIVSALVGGSAGSGDGAPLIDRSAGSEISSGSSPSEEEEEVRRLELAGVARPVQDVDAGDAGAEGDSTALLSTADPGAESRDQQVLAESREAAAKLVNPEIMNPRLTYFSSRYFHHLFMMLFLDVGVWVLITFPIMLAFTRDPNSKVLASLNLLLSTPWKKKTHGTNGHTGSDGKNSAWTLGLPSLKLSSLLGSPSSDSTTAHGAQRESDGSLEFSGIMVLSVVTLSMWAFSRLWHPFALEDLRVLSGLPNLTWPFVWKCMLYP